MRLELGALRPVRSQSAPGHRPPAYWGLAGCLAAPVKVRLRVEPKNKKEYSLPTSGNNLIPSFG
jgi:hypothetical protein